MTTLAELRATVREILPSAEVWPEATINAWIQEAIQDFSGYFPRETSGLLDLTDDERAYALSDLVAGIFAVIQVEYPYGEDPPRFLARKQESAGSVGQAVVELGGSPPRGPGGGSGPWPPPPGASPGAGSPRAAWAARQGWTILTADPIRSPPLGVAARARHERRGSVSPEPRRVISDEIALSGGRCCQERRCEVPGQGVARPRPGARRPHDRPRPARARARLFARATISS